MTSAEAVRAFLDAVGVPSDRIPIGVEAQASLYRSILAGRRVLVVLDNARDAAQVRPLLPGSPGCFVIVASRARLTSLVAVEGARPLTVGLLSDAEARELLVQRLGADRVAAEPDSVAKIVGLCARLPLALSVVAARAAINPGFSLARLAEELSGTRNRLEALEGGEVNDDVRAAFSWSYQHLDPSAARAFRLLGLHPGPDATAAAVASLAGIEIAHVRRTLTELARCNLRQAIDLFTMLDDPIAESESYIQFAVVSEQQGRYADALIYAQRALDLSCDLGTPRKRAIALNNVGWFHALLGHPEQTLTYCREALAIHRELGDRRTEANTLDSLGYAHFLLEQATAAGHELDDRHGLAANWTTSGTRTVRPMNTPPRVMPGGRP
jgi:tetratricopeptide (TPR) repeat protein